MTNQPSNRIFLCHSSGDKAAVRDLYDQLRAGGFNPWLDEQDILPGQDWEREIARAVRSSAVVLVCLSRSAVSKAGFIQKEIKYALDVADEQPEGAIFIIPVRLEGCEVPDRLSKWHWVDLFENRGYDRILTVLVMKRLSARRVEIPSDYTIRQIRTLRGHAAAVQGVAVSDDGRAGGLRVL